MAPASRPPQKPSSHTHSAIVATPVTTVVLCGGQGSGRGTPPPGQKAPFGHGSTASSSPHVNPGSGRHPRRPGVRAGE
eukprot:30853-Rhodomonas_salina.1